MDHLAHSTAAPRSVTVTLETLLYEELLKPLAGMDDRLASYGIESFAHLLAERLNPQ